jgi:hypothetical protein
MTKRLESFRHGPWGTVLFYGYLVAVIIVGALTLAALHGIRDSNHRLKQEIARGQIRDERSCRSIAGAGAFWALERKAVDHLLREPTLTPIERSAYLEVRNGLTLVVAKTSHPTNCEAHQ